MLNFASRAVDRQDNDAISSNNSSCSSSQDITITVILNNNELLNINAFLISVSVLFSLNKIGLCTESIRFYQK